MPNSSSLYFLALFFRNERGCTLNNKIHPPFLRPQLIQAILGFHGIHV